MGQSVIHIYIYSPDFCQVEFFFNFGPEDERCPHFRGCYVQASVELGPEDVSLLERCPHFRGWYVQVSVELGPEDVSILERCPHCKGCYTCTGFNGVGT